MKHSDKKCSDEYLYSLILFLYFVMFMFTVQFYHPAPTSSHQIPRTNNEEFCFHILMAFLLLICVKLAMCMTNLYEKIFMLLYMVTFIYVMIKIKYYK